MSTSPVLEPGSCSLATSNIPNDSQSMTRVRNTTIFASGWNVTRNVDHILKNQLFGKWLENPMAAFGGLSIGLLNCVCPFFTAGRITTLAAMAIACTKVKRTYSAEQFKDLLQQKYLFPPNCTVIGSLDFSNCVWIKSLPEGLTVQGDLDLSGCTGLISLPEGLTVQGNLDLSGCTGLTSLPEELIVQKNLALNGCTGLISLPEGLTVRGYLNLTNCTGLTSLPQGLTVQGYLYLTNCTGLTWLPEELIVQDNLFLDGCTGLTSLPTWITTLGLLADGSTREIYLQNTGLSEALLNRLRETPAPGIQFHFSNAAAVPDQEFPNLEAALTFWVQATNDATLVNPPITIDSDEALENILRFLSRLTETAEYKNPQARPVLAQRIIEAFNLMAEDASIKGRAFEIIHEGLTTCDDRIISALEEFELMALLHRIENTSHSEVELRELGKRFLLLEMVNEKARAHLKTLTWVDEIEVYLAFQIGLAERLNLPVKTRNMIFKRCAQVTDAQIEQAGDAVVIECTEEKLNDFLKNWGPWIAHQRKNGPVPAYEDLPVISRKLESGEICPLTQDIPEKPVLCGSAVYAYQALIHCYRTSGKNPIDRSEIDLKTLKRVVPSKE